MLLGLNIPLSIIEQWYVSPLCVGSFASLQQPCRLTRMLSATPRRVQGSDGPHRVISDEYLFFVTPRYTYTYICIDKTVKVFWYFEQHRYHSSLTRLLHSNFSVWQVYISQRGRFFSAPSSSLSPVTKNREKIRSWSSKTFESARCLKSCRSCNLVSIYISWLPLSEI